MLIHVESRKTRGKRIIFYNNTLGMYVPIQLVFEIVDLFCTRFNRFAFRFLFSRQIHRF